MTETNAEATEATERKSIIPAKYAEAYKDREVDWIGEFIGKNCVDVVKNEKGKESTVLDVDRLFELADMNGIDVSKYKDQVDRPNAPGRLRMTIGNMLRARAKRRLGLMNCNGKWSNLPEGALGVEPGTKPTENRDGTKIAKPKAKEEASEATEDAAAEAA